MKPPKLNISMKVRDTDITLRPITPEDRGIEADFVRKLSPDSRYLRFHTVLRELTPQMLDCFTQIHFPDSFALIATIDVEGKPEEIAVARYVRYPDSDGAEVAIVVADQWQNWGIGTKMLTELRDVAIAAGIKTLYMNVLPSNSRMLSLAKSLGFHPAVIEDSDTFSGSLGKSIGE